MSLERAIDLLATNSYKLQWLNPRLAEISYRSRLRATHIGCLQALGPLRHFEAHLLPLLE